MSWRRRFERLRYGIAAAMLAMTIASAAPRTAFALIVGGEGNNPVPDPGWPKGALEIFNNAGRVAWWEGPPFGGGQSHAECRGDAKAFNAVLVAFAKLDVKAKRIVVHDGFGSSFWLDPNHAPAKQADARVDWVFMVWQTASWNMMRSLPGDLNPTDPGDAEKGPPSQIDVYTGGGIHWSDVIVPKGLVVADERLAAHGFTLEDGIVLEGNVRDLATRRPIVAKMQLQRIEPRKEGGYRYTVVAEAVADAHGHWVLKKAPAKWNQVVVEAEGYVPRIAGYMQYSQPGWHSFESELSRPGPVSGRATDDAGKPLADVEVRVGNVVCSVGGLYQSPQEYKVKTDADGNFRLDQVPIASATIWGNKSGYCGLGLGQPIHTPVDGVALRLSKAANVRVSVVFTGTVRPTGYIVKLEPEGGEAVGKWSGSGNIDAKDRISFDDVPPGRYVLHGQPNPSSGNERTKPLAIELKGGETREIELSAK